MASLSPQQESVWASIWGNFKDSNYITDGWNWLMTLLSKSAEPVLFGSVLYSGYELLPNVPHPPALLDALVFIVQSAALDIGGMGLLKLAKRAGLSKDSFPARVGVILVALMIANVTLASIKQAYPMAPAGLYLFIETGLLIARAVMAVLFGHAIYALREEVGDVSFTVKDVQRLEGQIERVSLHLSEQVREVHSCVVGELQELIQATLPSVVQRAVAVQVSEMQEPLQGRVAEQVNHLLPVLAEQVETGVANRMHSFLEEAISSDARELQVLAEQLQAVSLSVQEIRATFTGARVNREQRTPLAGAQPSTRKRAVTEQEDSSLEFRVKRFITEQRRNGREPSLSEIMSSCGCSKNPVIRYRRELDGLTNTEHLPAVRA